MLERTPIHDATYVTVDIEASGCCPGSNSIIELGAARIENGAVVGVFSELIRPHDPIPPAVQQLTGISEAMVADAPLVDDVVPRFRDFAEGAILVAHNHRFDLGFLDYEAERLWGAPFQRPVLDTVTLAKRLHPETSKQNLAHLSQLYEIATTPTHRADADALATAQILIKMLDELGAHGVHTVADLARFTHADRQHVLVDKLPLTAGLPPEPGVFMLRDGEGCVIHVGTAKNLRLNVRNTFYSSDDSPKRAMAEETMAIDAFPCASEFDAMLVESRLVRRYQPRYNTRGRASSGPRVLVHVDTKSDFPAFRVTHRPGKRGTTIGPFTSRAAVDRTIEHLREVFDLRRCTRRINGTTVERPCDLRDTDGCPAPCLGELESAEYRRRVDEALSTLSTGSRRYRNALVDMLAESENASRMDDVIRYREALRAYERLVSSLRTVKGAQDTAGPIIVDAGEHRVALHFVRGGYVAKTLRATRDEALTPTFAADVERLVTRLYFTEGPHRDPLNLSPQKLREIFMVANHRTRERPVEIAVTDSAQGTARTVIKALERAYKARSPRRTHVA
jgi:DNA polymerase-3 subunit epsilon